MSSARASIAWWGASSVEIAVGDERVAVDPYHAPAEPRFQCVCVTREDYDHCHEPTLRALTAGDAFERLVAPRACTVMSKLDAPVPAGAADLDFVPEAALTILEAKHTCTPRAVAGRTEVDVGGFSIEGVDSSDREPVTVLDRWQRYRVDGGEPWPNPVGPFVGMGELTPLGYVIEHRETGFACYHPGDLQEVFDSHAALAGRIDCLFLPLVGLEGVEISLIDRIRPRYVVPIHYRLATPDFPIPLDAAVADLEPRAVDRASGRPLPGAAPDAYRREVQELMAGHWYPSPSPDDPLARLRAIEPTFVELGAEVMVLDPGRPWEVPDEQS
jgi:L-ascorbate metabolism protein UlaG (beta-lactamase superfamily)